MRSDAREAAFRIVFADLFGGDKEKQFRAAVYKQAKLKEDEAAFAERIVNAVLAHKEELSSEITKGLEIIPVENMDEVLERALTGE